MKRALSILMTILMVISLLSAQVLAVEAVASGSCGAQGDDVTWELSGDGTLTIKGAGEMQDYAWGGKGTPWDREAVKRLVVEEGVTKLGGYALQDCVNLIEVSLPQSLETIGSGTFRGCTALTEITVPEGVQDLGADAFVDCSGLKRVTLPNSIVETGGALFARCTSLTDIVWPEKLSCVGWYMFYGCTKLESVELPRDLKTVANEAFEGCSALKTVQFGGTKEMWQGISFGTENEALTSATVECMGKEALAAPKMAGTTNERGCPVLTWESVEGAARYEVWRSIIRKDMEELGLCNCYCISSQDISNQDLTRFVDQSNLEEGASYLYRVYAVDQKGKIGASSATYLLEYHDTTPTSGSCGENVTWVLSDDGTLTISGAGEMDDYTFPNKGGEIAPWNCAAVKRLVVEEGVTKLGGCALLCCVNLTEVSLPKSLETIGNGVFRGCTALEEVVLPEGVRYLGSDIFVGCSGLKRVALPDSIVGTDGALFAHCTSLTDIAWPEKLSCVGWHMFYGCTKLESVELPRDLKTVANEAFEGCSALKNVRFGGTKEMWQGISFGTGNEALTSASVECTGEEALAAPKMVGTTNERGYPVLTWESVEGAARYEVWRSTVSEAKWGPDNCCRISSKEKESTRFVDQGNLEEGASYLYRVYAVDQKGKIGASSATYLLEYHDTTPTSGSCGENVTWVLGDDGTLTISGAGEMDDYTWLDSDGEIAPWNREAVKRLVVEEGVTKLGGCALLCCVNLTEVSLPKSLETMGHAAFQGCAALEEAVLPEGLRYLYSNAFVECKSLEKIVLPESLEWIEGAIFGGCEKLKEAVLPSTMTDIGWRMFYGCTALSSITLPRGLTSVEEEAFEGCTALQTVYYGGAADMWQKVAVGSGNERLTAAQFVYGIGANEGVFATEGAVLTVSKDGVPQSVSVSKGKYSFDGLMAGTYTIRAEKEGYVPYECEFVYTGANRPLDIELVRVGDVNGAATTAGAVDATDLECLYALLSTGRYSGQIADDGYQKAVADVNGDGAINILDYQALYMLVREMATLT